VVGRDEEQDEAKEAEAATKFRRLRDDVASPAVAAVDTAETIVTLIGIDHVGACGCGCECPRVEYFEWTRAVCPLLTTRRAVMGARVGRPLACIRTLYTRGKKKAETEDKDFHKTECRREEIQQKTQIVKPKFRQFFEKRTRHHFLHVGAKKEIKG